MKLIVPKTLLLCSLLVSLLAFRSTEVACSCCSSEYQEFAFGIGEWEVRDTAGLLLGNNSMEFLKESCIMAEHWKGTRGSGRFTPITKTYSYYNKKDASRNQVWIYNSGGVLNLKGGLLNGSMFLKSELIPCKKVDLYYHQISLTGNSIGTLTQKWEVFKKDGTLLQNVFCGIYQIKINDQSGLPLPLV